MVRKREMRKRYRVLLLAVVVAAFIVPVGFALSLEADLGAPYSQARAMTVGARTSTAAGPVFMRTSAPFAPFLPAIPEGAKLFAVGTVLFGLAAVMRKSV
jgi:hypothetical protein